MPVPPQPTYEIYVDDDRYAVPTLHLVVGSEDDAREAMNRLLSENPHHRGAEVCLEGRMLFRACPNARSQVAAEECVPAASTAAG